LTAGYDREGVKCPARRRGCLDTQVRPPLHAIDQAVAADLLLGLREPAARNQGLAIGSPGPVEYGGMRQVEGVVGAVVVLLIGIVVESIASRLGTYVDLHPGQAVFPLDGHKGAS
jgi:hypothetical protein